MKKTEMCWLKAKVKPTKQTPICMHVWEDEDSRAIFLGIHDGKNFIDFRGQAVKPDHYFYMPCPPESEAPKKVVPIKKPIPIKKVVKKCVKTVAGR